MTDKVLEKGFKEVGIVNSRVVAKWGVNGLPVACFVEACVFSVLWAVFATHGMKYGFALVIPFVVAEIYNDIKNARLLKML